MNTDQCIPRSTFWRIIEDMGEYATIYFEMARVELYDAHGVMIKAYQWFAEEGVFCPAGLF